MSDLTHLSAVELGGRIAAGEILPSEIMTAAIEKIERLNPTLNAFVALRAEQALEEARALDERISAGERIGPLAGIPIAVKDLEDVGGMVTSCGSTALKDQLADRDSVQVARLKRAGAIVIGKTNTPEFGFLFFTKNRLYGTTPNPWRLDRTSGGSSGGAAAAVAGGMLPMATGSDAGGSIRTPAAFCGCFGLKTSAGRIPFSSFPGPADLLPMHPIGVLGPLTRTVADAALYLDCAAGFHPSDPVSLPAPTSSYAARLEDLPRNLRIAFSPDLGYAKVQGEVLDLVEAAARSFEQMGCRVEPWHDGLPDVCDGWATLVNCDFYAQIHDLLKTSRRDLGRSLVAILEESKDVTFDDLLSAQAQRTVLNKRLWELFDDFDLLLTPTMPMEAFGAGGPPPDEIDGTPIALLGALAFTYPFNLSGNPAASVPAGFTASGLPAGLQIVGPRQRDDLVLQAARAFEKAMPWEQHRPPIG